MSEQNNGIPFGRVNHAADQLLSQVVFCNSVNQVGRITTNKVTLQLYIEPD